MAEVDGSSSNNGKPVIVRVKRKLFQSPLEAFWLEINERPLKRQHLDFAKLSISRSPSPIEELNPPKVLVRRVETVTTEDDSLHLVLQSVLQNSDFERKTKVDKRKKLYMDTKQDKLLSKGKHEQEQLAKSARFEQIWRSRKGKRESTNEVMLQKACRLYDVVRVDVHGPSKEVQNHRKDSSVEDYVNLHKYLPLMKEIIPTAAEEVESDIRAYMSSKASGEDYVYDIYAVEEECASNLDVCAFPLVRVDEDDDFNNGLSDSECDTDDSNAEGNPLHDYPDEETSEEEGEGNKESDEEFEESESESVSGSKESLDFEYNNKDVYCEEEDDDGHPVYDSLDNDDCMEDRY